MAKGTIPFFLASVKIYPRIILGTPVTASHANWYSEQYRTHPSDGVSFDRGHELSTLGQVAAVAH